MPKTYDQAPDEVHDRVRTLFHRYYTDTLKAVGAKIDLLMVSTDAEDAHALTHGGYPALATVRIIGAKDRAKGCGDAEIVIDRDAYEGMTSSQRDALLDHELYHLDIKRGRTGQPKFDDHKRPCFTMRKHDIQVGWFAEIARRHKENSHEVRQATEIHEEYSQLLFGFAESGGKAEDVAFRRSSEKSPVEKFGDKMRAHGATSVTISSGGNSVQIDGHGIHPEVTAEHIDEATKLAFRDGHVSRSSVQRALRIGYNHACAIVDRLVAAKIVSPEATGDTTTPAGRFVVAATAAPAA